MRRFVLLASLPLVLSAPVLSTPVRAQQDDDGARASAVTAALQELLQLSAFADANASLCAEVAPDAASAVAGARDAWRASQGLEEPLARLRALNADAARTLDALYRSFEADALDRTRAKIREREADWCARFPALLSGPDWRLADRYGQEIATLDDFVATVTGEPVRRPRRELSPVATTGYAAGIAAGIDPDDAFLPGEFACYDEAASSFGAPHLVVQVAADGTYRSGIGDGRYAYDAEYAGNVDWTSGALSGARGTIDFDEHGQAFSLDGVTEGEGEGEGEDRRESDYRCFARGPSEEYARATFAAKVPLAGDYACRDPDGNPRTLALTDGGEYRIQGAAGRWTLGDVIGDGDASRITWTGGPFDGGGSFYTADAEDGYRDFDVSVSDGKAYPSFVYSSSELALSCGRAGPPLDVPRHGEAKAPVPPPPGTALDGFYTREEYVASGAGGRFVAAFYRFFPDGHVFRGTPEGNPADIDCTLTHPSGAPVCEVYAAGNGRLVIGTGDDADAYGFGLDGDALTVDGEPMVAVGHNDRGTIDGPYWANYFDQVGICGEFSFCTSTYLEWNYRFTPDGRFAYSTSSQNLASMNTAIGNTNVTGGSADSRTGAYRIDDHVIELAWDDGRSERRFIHFLEPDTFVMGDEQYSRKEEDE